MEKQIAGFETFDKPVHPTFLKDMKHKNKTR
jgi:hypothetical protein